MIKDDEQLARIERKLRYLQFSIAWGGTWTSAALIVIIILLLLK